MLVVSIILAGLGFIVALVGWFKIIVAAFRQSFFWGLGALLTHIVMWAFVGRYWKKAKGGFYYYAAGTVVTMIGALAISVSLPDDWANDKPKPAATAPAPARKSPATRQTARGR